MTTYLTRLAVRVSTRRPRASRRYRRRVLPRLLELTVAGVLLLLAAGCGGGDGSPHGAAPAPAVTDAELVAAVPACRDPLRPCGVLARVEHVGAGRAFVVAVVERAPAGQQGFGDVYAAAVPLAPPPAVASPGPGAAVAGVAASDALPVAALAVGAVGSVTTDSTGHVFASLSVGADGQQLLALDVDTAGRLRTFGTLTERRDHGFDTGSRTVGSRVAEARDVDVPADGVRELVVGHDDCRPDCAHGTVVGTVLRWDGADYTAAQCLPYDAHLLPAGPPTALPPGRTRC